MAVYYAYMEPEEPIMWDQMKVSTAGYRLWGLYGDDNLGSSKSRIWLESMVTSVYVVMTVYMDMTVRQAISIPVGL